MREKEDEIEELRNLMIEKTDKMDKVLKKVARVLASNTNYATMISVQIGIQKQVQLQDRLIVHLFIQIDDLI